MLLQKDLLSLLSATNNILNRIIFLFPFRTVGLNSQIKISSKLCYKKMHYYPGFVVLFVELKQSRFLIILKSPVGFFLVVNVKALAFTETHQLY